MIKPTVEQIKAVMAKKRYKIFLGEHNLNLIGIRNAGARHSNDFNDLFCVLYEVDSELVLHCFDCTTDPGLYYRQNPINENGTAVLAPGRYPGLWRIGLHQGKYSALVQARPVGVYRDSDGNASVDAMGELDVGWHGINCHRATASGKSVRVDKWSAGCQVIAASKDFELLMELAARSAGLYGSQFTYTLLESSDFDRA